MKTYQIWRTIIIGCLLFLASGVVDYILGKLVEHERRSAPRRCGEISKN
ncbi:hypothetical protein [Enterococcus lactis]|nr:hypothetical protein [Enterococcus lactis]